MASSLDPTTFLGLERLGAGDEFSDDDYAFTDANPVLVDRILWELLHHTHGAEVLGGDAPTDAPTLDLDITSGDLIGGVTATYAVTLVKDSLETVPSPAAGQVTPALLASPAAPTVAVAFTGGELSAGNYIYVLSYFQGVRNSLVETRADNPLTVALRLTNGNAQKVTLTLPALPDGADGWNIYRQQPNSAYSHLLASVEPADVPGGTFVDDGTTHADCERITPPYNTTSTTNTITVTPPTVPTGATWRLYRTFDTDDWSDSFLGEFPRTQATFVDDGTTPAAAGQPPTGIGNLTMPGQVPPIGVNAYPVQVELRAPGAVTVGPGTIQWVCPFDKAIIRDAVVTLGVGSTPDAQAVIATVAVNGTDAFTGEPLTIAPATTTATGFDPDYPSGQPLVLGDTVRLDVTQDGGGAHTDVDLCVILRLWVQDLSVGPIVFP